MSSFDSAQPPAGTLWNTGGDLAVAAVPVHRNAGKSERAAATRAAKRAPTDKVKALRWLIASGVTGMTGMEVATRYVAGTGLHPCEKRWAIQPRLSDLVRLGYATLSDTIIRNHNAAYIVTDAGREAMKEWDQKYLSESLTVAGDPQ